MHIDKTLQGGKQSSVLELHATLYPMSTVHNIQFMNIMVSHVGCTDHGKVPGLHRVHASSSFPIEDSTLIRHDWLHKDGIHDAQEQRGYVQSTQRVSDTLLCIPAHHPQYFLTKRSEIIELALHLLISL